MKDTTPDKAKPELSLIVPDFLLGMAEVLTNGRGAHDEWSFLGETIDDQYNSLMRHVLAFRRGENLDAGSGSHHLLHAACRGMFMWYLAQLRDDEIPARTMNEKTKLQRHGYGGVDE